MVNLRNFTLNSEYPPDMIAFMREGKITIPKYSNGIKIKHNLPFTPLCLGTWSLDKDFKTSQDFHLALFTPPNILTISLYADGTHFIINGLTVKDTVIYYRIFGFVPSDYDGYVSSYELKNKFTLNSQFNYLKTHMVGVLKNVSQKTIYHNLSYKPMVMIWVENNNGVFKQNLGDFLNQEFKITDNELIINNTNISVSKIHYRIYGDD